MKTDKLLSKGKGCSKNGKYKICTCPFEGHKEKIQNKFGKLPQRIDPINASPAPVVSISSDGGTFSAVPTYNFPKTVPIPSACNFVTDWKVNGKERYK